ncbi:MAG: dockerin type I domain-containing protein, partial [Planctomycetota bacterium]|nr:dockerin type I domain-containing protein [Planctomycetota bacterium]
TFTPVSFGALEGFGTFAPNNGNFQGLSTGTGSDTTFNTNLDRSGTLGNDAALIINADRSNPATSSSAMQQLGLVDQALADLTGSTAQLDINGDQRVTAADALMVINFLARSQSSTIVDDDDATGMDFNGDGRVTALDALRVINRVSRNSVRQ